MAYQPPGLLEPVLGAIRSELNARRSEASAHAEAIAEHSRAIAALEARVRRLEASTGGTTCGRPAGSPAGGPASEEPQKKRQPAVFEAELEELSHSGLSDRSAEEEEEDDGGADEQPPESFFTYSIVMIQVRNRAALDLLLYIAALCTLSGCWLDASSLRLILDRWGGSDGSYDQACFYQGLSEGHRSPFNLGIDFRKAYGGVSLPFASVGVFCLLLLALYQKDAHMNRLYQAAIADAGEVPRRWKLLVMIAEVARTILVPIKVAAGAALQLSQSYDVLDLILNAFAATFLFEMDGLLYGLVLSPGEKSVYQGRWKRLQRSSIRALKPDDTVPNLMFVADMALLATLFFAFQVPNLGWSDGSDFHFEVARFGTLLFVSSILVRAYLVRLSMARIRSRGMDAAEALMVACYSSLAVLMHVLYRIFFASDSMLDYAAVSSCQSGANSSACSCGGGAG